MKDHEQVKHPKDLRKTPTSAAGRFNTWLAVKITKGVGSMWCAYIFVGLDLIELPPVIRAHSVITWVTYVAQTMLQLILLPIIMVGQNVIQDQNDAKANVDHQTLTYLANLQDRQMIELEGITKILETVQKKVE